MKNIFWKILIFGGIAVIICYFFTPFVIEKRIEKVVEEEVLKGIVLEKGADHRDIIGTEDEPLEAIYAGAATISNSASSTRKIDDSTDTIDFKIHIISASTTGYVYLNLEVSDDSACNTSSTTEAQTIKWVDVNPQSSASSEVITLDDVLTKWSWTPGGNSEGTKVKLTNFNAECIRATVEIASSTVWVEMREKTLFY